MPILEYVRNSKRTPRANTQAQLVQAVYTISAVTGAHIFAYILLYCGAGALAVFLAKAKAIETERFIAYLATRENFRLYLTLCWLHDLAIRAPLYIFPSLMESRQRYVRCSLQSSPCFITPVILTLPVILQVHFV